ncbi:MAG: peptide ABC transporter substrate-binding protein [Chloroflexota bacterium]|nr:peptide ABC transporter substrate-binding protein [Chloroflexota bacterium]
MKTRLTLLLIVVMALSSLGGVAIAQDMNEVSILYWQASSILNPYLSGGTKDIDASAIVLEPLANWAPDGSLNLNLAAEIPTLENGGISEDLTSITWNLRDDIVWSDGTPFTADDVVFTWEYCTHPEAGCVQADEFVGVVSVEAMGMHSVTVTFDAPKPNPFRPFVSHIQPILQKAQFGDCVGAEMAACSDQNFAPIGTGPFIVEEFRPNDVVTYVRNPNYRDADMGKPAFDRVVFKGGGDAESAARAVLETGEADYAWNLQISPAVLDSMEAAGNGQVVVAYGQAIETIWINSTDVSPDNPNRSVWMADGSNAHPFLSNKAIRQAMSMAIDTNILAEQLYGRSGQATCNFINSPASNVSPNTSCDQDIAGAIALLDEAGVLDSDGDGIREYDGHPLRVQYQTSTNAVRQNTQALIKQWWAEIGIETELRNIDAGVFFGGDPASPDTYQKFYSDVEMYTTGSSSPDMESLLSNNRCGQAPGPDNNWTGSNIIRFCNADYDAALDELSSTAGQDARAAVIIRLNDILVQEYALIPLVYRSSASSAFSNSLGGVDINGWDSEMWNIEDWYRADM